MKDACAITTLRILQAADEIKARLAGELAAVHGLSVNEFFLLSHLDQATLNRLSRVELARRMHLNASTVTRMASPMEKTGLLTRQASDRDARLAYVVLTTAGKTKLKEARRTFVQQARSNFEDRWSEADIGRLSKLLYRLVSGTSASLT